MSDHATPPEAGNQPDWSENYFNYFTEVEEHFQRARGTALFLLSPLDWALIESWKNAGVPLSAVIKGIDDAFEKWRARKVKRQSVNSIAYCAQAIAEAAQRASSPRPGSTSSAEPPFGEQDLGHYLDTAADALAGRPEPVMHEVASSLRILAENANEHLQNLEDLERRLTSLEEKVVAALRTAASEDQLYSMREALDRELRPYRGKMSADQLAILERRYLDSALLERAKLPRLSLFYLH